MQTGMHPHEQTVVKLSRNAMERRPEFFLVFCRSGSFPRRRRGALALNSTSVAQLHTETWMTYRNFHVTIAG